MNEKSSSTLPDQCWNVIGIFGDRSCARLADFIHCRYCGIFTARGVALLDRPSPAEYTRYWTEELARIDIEEFETKELISILTFRIADQWLGLPTAFIQQVTARLPIRRLPHRSGRILLGLVNVQGALRLCASMHALFSLETPPAFSPGEHNDKQRMIVVEKNKQAWVFPVDELGGLTHYHSAEMENTPVAARKTAEPVVTKGTIPLERGVIGLIDEDELLLAFRRSLR